MEGSIANKLEIERIFKMIETRESLVAIEGDLETFYSFDEAKADYIQGLIHLQMTASRKYEKISMKLATRLNIWVEDNDLGEVYGARFAIAIEPDYHPEPDIVFISKTNPGEYSDVAFHGIPDLVIEILSKSTRKLDLEEKRPLYQKHQVPEIYWIDPENETIEIDQWLNSTYETLVISKEEVYESKLLLGFSLKATQIFQKK